jgi:Kef-type K+ transport system membrane component KefB
MKRVLLFSVLLAAGLAGSQLLPGMAGGAAPVAAFAIRVATMLCLAFIMIHVGYEFELDRTRLRSLAADYGIAATAAAFPWIFAALYFVLVVLPPGASGSAEAWKEALLTARFAAPTSAGILFSMLAAAGLAATWLYRKARVLAILDDLDTVLLMIPLKILLVGWRWQLAIVVAIMAVLLWAAWRWLHAWKIPVSWAWVLGYAAAIVGVTELVHLGSTLIDDSVPIHVEVLLPAFVLGCVLGRPAGVDPHTDDARPGHQDGPASATEQRVATAVSALFMLLVGLSMPVIRVESGAWANLAAHTLAITVLANLGKMFPLLCYRAEAGWRERLALCIGMWPRGEVGAGVLVVSIGYGIGGDMLAVATLSLALNLLLTGVFIAAVKRLLAGVPRAAPTRGDVTGASVPSALT